MIFFERDMCNKNTLDKNDLRFFLAYQKALHEFQDDLKRTSNFED